MRDITYNLRVSEINSLSLLYTSYNQLATQPTASGHMRICMHTTQLLLDRARERERDRTVFDGSYRLNVPARTNVLSGGCIAHYNSMKPQQKPLYCSIAGDKDLVWRTNCQFRLLKIFFPGQIRRWIYVRVRIRILSRVSCLECAKIGTGPRRVLFLCKLCSLFSFKPFALQLCTYQA